MEKIRKADLLFSIALMIFAGVVFFGSGQLIYGTLSRGEYWYRSAGLFPAIAATFLMISAIKLFKVARAVTDFKFLSSKNIFSLFLSRGFRVGMTIVALLGLYIFVLLKFIPYPYATFIFLFTFMCLFCEKTPKAFLKALALSAISSVALTYGFGTLAQIPLP